MYIRKHLAFAVLFLIFFLHSCKKEEVFIPDVSNITTNYNIIEFHKDLAILDSTNIREVIGQFQQDHPAFYEIYFAQVLQLERIAEDSFFLEQIADLLVDERVRKVIDTTLFHFPDLHQLKKEFDDAFSYFKYYFPDRELPNIYTLISEFGYSTFIFSDENGRDAIGVGLDMFLGEQFPYRKMNPGNPAFSQYITRTFNADHIVKKSIDALIDDIVPKGPKMNMLDWMIYNGKKQYLVDIFMPLSADSIKLEYTHEQTKWVQANETEIWKHFIAEELLYETQMVEFVKLVTPSPSSPGMPKEAPGRTANFIGQRIIAAFVKNNPEVALEKMLNNLDAQDILNKSKYRPRNSK